MEFCTYYIASHLKAEVLCNERLDYCTLCLERRFLSDNDRYDILVESNRTKTVITHPSSNPYTTHPDPYSQHQADT